MDALDRFAPHSHWLLRFALASVFLYHGITKFPMLEMLAGMMEMPVAMVGMLAAMETLAGLLILVGGVSSHWFTRSAGAIVVVIMIGAIAMVHWPHGWNSVNMGMGNEGRGMQFQVTLIAIALYFVIVGNGRPTAHEATVSRGEPARRAVSAN
jgi:putative oxidoreductase